MCDIVINQCFAALLRYRGFLYINSWMRVSLKSVTYIGRLRTIYPNIPGPFGESCCVVLDDYGSFKITYSQAAWTYQ